MKYQLSRAFWMFVRAVVFWLTLFIFMELGLLAFGAIITHSHCPNHSRNNSENMHTHDTTDADHNAKHVTGHPHTYEFDEFCPKGTERDTSKKSTNIQDFPAGPSDPVSPRPRDDDRDDSTDDVVLGGYLRSEPSAPEASIQSNILKIMHVSFVERFARGGRRTEQVLTIEVTAVAPDTRHSGLVVVVDGQSYRTPAGFFGAGLLGQGEVRRFTLSPRPTNAAVHLKLVSPRKSTFVSATQAQWQALERFDSDDFVISIVGKDTVTHSDFDMSGNRIGYTAGAPRLVKPKLTTMWASLKVSK